MTQGTPKTERESWLAFSWAGLGPECFEILEHEFGDMCSAFANRDRALAKIRLSRDKRASLKNRLARFDLTATMAELDRLKISYVCRFEPRYPQRLRAIDTPPPVLYIRGNPELLHKPAIAIVGSRRASEYGKRQTRRFADYCAKRDVVVISGLAYGIDAVAHESALVSGTSIAVIAGGLGVELMSWQTDLARRILQKGGAVVSELPPDVPPLKHHFPMRNRIIAGLTPVTLVGEARERSGALITARLAQESGATLMCIPHDIERVTAAGSNRLLRDGATLALTPEDVILELTRQLPDQVAATLRADDASRAAIVAVLQRPRSLEQLSINVKLTPELLAKKLIELELDGSVKRLMDGRFCLA